MVDSFWVGGNRALKSAVREHYSALMDELRTELDACPSDLERSACQDQIGQIEREYKSKLKEIKGPLF